MTTGQLIKEARKRAGMTQEELGEKLGVSGSFVAQYETGKRNPKYETLQRIAVALGVNWTELVDKDTRVSVSMEYLGRKAVTNPPLPIDRVRQIMMLMDTEGQEKVVTYAEDIFPCHRKTIPPKPPKDDE